MKEKINKIKISKSQIMTIVLAGFVSIIFSMGTSYAATTIFSSSDVGFDNTGTKIQATTVQGAIDELYDAATDYSSMNTRVNDVETIVSNNLIECVEFEKTVSSWTTQGNIYQAYIESAFPNDILTKEIVSIERIHIWLNDEWVWIGGYVINSDDNRIYVLSAQNVPSTMHFKVCYK